MKRYQPWRKAVLIFIFLGTTILAKEAIAKFPHEFRTIDGTANNLEYNEWGSTNIKLLRLTPEDYGDDNSPAGAHRKSAREISNAVCDQSVFGSRSNSKGLSDFVWQWGQFLDHDIDLTGPAAPPEPFDIPVPDNDCCFDDPIPFLRSDYIIDGSGFWQQLNEITAYIDASNVYGSDPDTAMSLRTLDGTGMLRTSPGEYLPFADGPSSGFLAGDVRVNEQIALTAMHTLFVREHNYWASVFKQLYPDMNGDDFYELARAMVGAEMQAITYNEFLPVLLGPNALGRYKGYDPTVNSGIANGFSTAAYRFGHSMLSPALLLIGENGERTFLPLRDAFFNPEGFIEEGMYSILLGLANQKSQEVDNFVVDDVRNLLFGPPSAGGLDLAALNIQRGRDHGIAGYNQTRMAYGLPRVDNWDDFPSSTEVIQKLQSVYSTVDDIDLWIGGLSEKHVKGALVGETFRAILTDQFKRLRYGDRFFYLSYLPRFWRRMVERRTLAEIIRQNTGIRDEIQDNVFVVDDDQGEDDDDQGNDDEN